MNLVGILIACLIVGFTGLIIGVLLGYAGKVFEVEVDEKEVKVRELLPGSNCGGCGYAGCDAFAEALVNGEAPADGCVAGGSETTAKVASILGVSAGESVKKVAFLACAGTRDCAKEKGIYDLWKSFLKISIEDIKEIYDKLNANFDLWEGEKDADPYIPEMLDYLINNRYCDLK